MKNKSMTKRMFFSYDHENGIEFHDTKEAAKEKVEKYFQQDQDNAPEGWPDEVEQICWGEVLQRVMEIKRKKARNKPYDIEVEYALCDI